MCITVDSSRARDVIGVFGSSPKVIVVAEIGNNHEGDFGLARELVAAAAACGSDAVKFQHFVPNRFVSASETNRLLRLRQYALSNDEMLSLFEYSNELGLEPFATGLDIETQKWLIRNQRVLKIASGDNNFLDLLKVSGESEIPTIISTGFLDMQEITELENWWRKQFVTSLAFLHCVAAYPASSSDLNLRTIATLSNLMPATPIGYSDHSIGNTAALAAVSLGAFMIEKHFTLDHNHSDFRDHKLSATPEELAELIVAVRVLECSLGNGRKIVTTDEKSLKEAVRRSAAAKHELPMGRRLSKDDIIYLRPGSGFQPNREAELLGRVLIRSVPAGQIIVEQDLNQP